MQTLPQNVGPINLQAPTHCSYYDNRILYYYYRHCCTSHSKSINQKIKGETPDVKICASFESNNQEKTVASSKLASGIGRKNVCNLAKN